jgi:hypothetical protein
MRVLAPAVRRAASRRSSLSVPVGPGQAQAFDVMHCAERFDLRTEVESLCEGDSDRELEALHRWQQHKDDQHPLFSGCLRRISD